MVKKGKAKPKSKATPKPKAEPKQTQSQKQTVIIQQVAAEKKAPRKKRAAKAKAPTAFKISTQPYAGATFITQQGTDPNTGRLYNELLDTLRNINLLKEKQQEIPLPKELPPTGLNRVNQIINPFNQTPQMIEAQLQQQIQPQPQPQPQTQGQTQPQPQIPTVRIMDRILSDNNIPFPRRWGNMNKTAKYNYIVELGLL